MDSYSKTTDAFFLKLLRQFAENTDFSRHNGVRVTNIYDGIGEGELEVGPKSLNPMGIVHGGCLAALADTVAGMAASCVSRSPCVTVNYAMNFLRPAKGSNKKIRCVAKPRKLGRTLCVYELSLTDDQDKVVATGDFTFFVNAAAAPGTAE